MTHSPLLISPTKSIYIHSTKIHQTVHRKSLEGKVHITFFAVAITSLCCLHAKFHRHKKQLLKAFRIAYNLTPTHIILKSTGMYNTVFIAVNWFGLSHIPGSHRRSFVSTVLPFLAVVRVWPRFLPSWHSWLTAGQHSKLGCDCLLLVTLADTS